jgi:hypothetical protein
MVVITGEEVLQEQMLIISLSVIFLWKRVNTSILQKWKVELRYVL